jgi:programmed cell death 6-interacting protein
MDKGRQLLEILSKATQDSESTNLNVYMDSIAPESSLKPIDDLSMLNPKFPPSVDVDSKTQGEECLMVLIPPEVRNIMNLYKERLMEMVRAENVSAADLRTQMQGVLASLSLPQKLDALSSSDTGLPEDVWAKVQEVNSRGGAIQVEKMMESLSVMNSSNLKLLEDVERMIKQEEDDDASHRTMFGPRWNRPLSQAGNAVLKQDLFKYREKTAQATAVDRAIVQTYQSAQASLQLTRKSREELSAMLPRAAATVDPSSPPIAQLRTALETVNTIEKQIAEELIILQTMADSDNIVGEIMQQYTARADLASVIAREMEKYGEARGRIGVLKSQEMEALTRVRTADRDFEQFAASVRTSAERVEFLRALSLGCGRFGELVNQLSQGMNFYRQLGTLIAQLQQRVSDFIIARNLEKNDLVMRLTAGSAPGGYPGYYQNPYK